MQKPFRLLLFLALFGVFSSPVRAAEPVYTEPLGSALETVQYPVAPRFLELEIEGQKVRMAYMDATRGLANGLSPFSPRPMSQPVAVLLHGKNFGGYYWGGPMRALAAAGYRVVVPDQIGFSKSGKPDIPYSFELLADNTKKLLDALKIEKAALVCHSMGGMLGVKFALKYPERVSKLILENPIGLEDYGPATGHQSIEKLFANELNADLGKTRAYYKTYFMTWKPQYERLVEIKFRPSLSGEWPRAAKASALTYQMILEQPVRQDFSKIQVPTLLIIGQNDRTVVGKNLMPPEKARSFGDYPALGKAAARDIPNTKLIELPGVGHIPHLEAPEKFEAALLEFLKS